MNDELQPPLNLCSKDQFWFRKNGEKPLTYIPQLIQIKNVFVTRSGIGMKNFKLLEETMPKYPGKRWHFLKYVLFNFLFRGKVNISGPAILIHNHWSSGYYHWLGEALPRLIFAEDFLKDHTLLLPENYPSFAIDSLRMFDVKRIFRIPFSKNLIVKHLVVPENPPYTAIFHREAILAIRERAHNFIMKNEENNLNLGEKIYVHREKKGNRRVLNGLEVRSFLEEKGYTTIDFENYNFWQQVSILYHARVLISIHGAGLTNQIFMKETGFVFEFQKEVFAGEQYSSTYFKLSQILNHKYLYQFCNPEDIKETIYTANIHVDLKELEENLALISN